MNTKPTALGVVAEQIPDILKDVSQWVGWKYVWKEDAKEWAKVPVDCADFSYASATNPATWTTFDKALEAYGDGKGLDGIGLVATKNLGMVFADLDRCLEDGEPNTTAAEFLSHCTTYTEISPSGTGLRFIGFGTKPAGFTNKVGTELYDDKRYLAITGAWWKSAPASVEHVDLGWLQHVTNRTVAPTIASGERNATLTSLAGSMRRRGMSTDAIEAALLAENAARCSPPLADGEVRGIATSVARYEPPAVKKVTIGNMTWTAHAATLTDIEWLWDRWLPRGFVTLLAAQSEIGKSCLALSVAGSFTDGRKLPDGKRPTQLGKVVWVDTEASQVLNYSRARKWGIDMTKFVVPIVGSGTEDISLTTDHGWASFVEACAIGDVELVVVDSLGGAVSKENDETMKDFVHKLAGLARDLGKPILLIHHPRKLAQGEVDEMSLDRVRGNSGIVQFCRVIWTIEVPDPYSDSKRLRVLKSNLAEKPQAIGFDITDGGVTFGFAPEKPEENSQVQKAMAIIRDVLRPGKPGQPASIFTERAKTEGVGQGSLKVAKRALCIRSEKSPEKGGGWLWSLPEEEKP